MNPDIRSLFSATNDLTYLNSAAVSPLPIPAVEAVHSQLKDVASVGSVNFPAWIATKNRTREMLSGMMCVRPEQIAFTRNTSDGMASVALGINWKKGDNIVSFEHEFPANFYAWRQIRDKFGVELRMCSERDGRIDHDEFIGLIDANTRVVTISAVQFASGFRADLERIGKAARAVDALFVVDVIQGLGAMAFDLPALYVDVAAGASHKWLCSPEGCGFLYISDRARQRIEPTLVGWISVKTPWDFEDREQSLKPNALAWESGTGPASLFYGMEQSLKLLIEAGPDNIDNHLLGLSDLLCELLAGKDYNIISSRRPEERSAIVCIKHRGGMHCTEISEQLEKENIIVSPRGDRLRISPHFYNNEADIEHLVRALP